MKILLKITAIAGLSLLSHQLMAQDNNTDKQVLGTENTLMGTAQLRNYNSLVAVLENVDFDVRYDIISYDAVLIKKNSDYAITAKGYGALFADNKFVNSLIKEARPGDRVIFENVKVKGRGPGMTNQFAKGSLIIKVR